MKSNQLILGSVHANGVEIMATNDSSKRRKTDGTLAACLGDLPIGILEHAASFLADPSRALFAIALTIDGNNNPPSEVEIGYSSIAGTDWDTLDFGEIEKELAAKLSDDDISDILRHIDAANNLKRLKLTNCTNITGAGLGPLRGSTVIEQIDLSLFGDGENPRRLDPEPPISCDIVLPILHSIIERECALKHLQFPYKWRRLSRGSTDSVFHAFVERYDEMWQDRDTVRCLNCESYIPPYLCQGDEYYGIHDRICSQCTTHFCSDCLEGGYCQKCQRDYCKNCVKLFECDECNQFTCEHCFNSNECDKCNRTICLGCVYNNEFGFECLYCGVLHCNNCNHIGDGRRMTLCEECNEIGCDDCRLRRRQEGSSDCDDCIKSLHHNTLVAHVKIQQEKVRHLENENKELKKLQEEVEQLKSENRELKLENKVLKDKEA